MKITFEKIIKTIKTFLALIATLMFIAFGVFSFAGAIERAKEISIDWVEVLAILIVAGSILFMIWGVKYTVTQVEKAIKMKKSKKE